MVLNLRGRVCVDSLYIEDLKEMIARSAKQNRHEMGDAYKMFPFNSHATAKPLVDALDQVLGSFILEITQNKIIPTAKLDYEFESQSGEVNNELSAFIAHDFFEDNDGNSDDELEFIKMLNNFLYTNGSFTPIHPYLFNLLNFRTVKKEDEYKAYGTFLADCFGEDTKLKEVFNDNTTNNILIKAILNSAQKLVKPKETKRDREYYSVLPCFTDLYKEDVAFLQQNKERFFKDFPLLTHYYLFMYVAQVIYKSESYLKADHMKATPLYFILENEKLSKRRKEANRYQSYEEVKERAKYLYAHMHTMSHLSYNVFDSAKNTLHEKNIVTLYSELKEKIDLENDPALEKDFIEKFQELILAYRAWKENPDTTLPATFEELIKTYVQDLTKGLNNGVQDKFSRVIEKLASKQFIKQRGSLGYNFNLKHDLLILLTSVIVKEDRMPLKRVFEELELRGITLDKYSKLEVIALYNAHNILDKKSDSGDAQYVKRIL